MSTTAVKTPPAERQDGSVELENLLEVSVSPHVRADNSISKIMWTVFIALLPALIFSVIHFGLPALRVLLIGGASAVAFEALAQKIRHKPITIADGSAFISGILLAMCLPPSVPFYLPIVGSFAGIIVAKHAMGGLGHNIFNPAHIGRAVLLASWPVFMTTWTSMPSAAGVDAVSSATPLTIIKHEGYSALLQVFGGHLNMYKDLFFGLRNGSIGETSVLLLILGGLFLIYKGYIDWVVPVFMIGTVGLLTWVFGPSGLFTGDPLFNMMAGGLVLGAFFMATDMVTSPITRKGRVVFAVGAGIIVVLIRLLGGYPEGVCYSILLMNAATPLIDRVMKPRAFGKQRRKRNVVA